MSRYCSLNIRTTPKGECIWIRCLRTTAEKFGWLSAFEEQEIGLARMLDPEQPRRRQLMRHRIDIGGHGIRICTGGGKKGHPAGSTFRLRCHSRVTNRDLAELAHFTAGEWEWLETMNRDRLTRLEWDAVYAVAK